MSVRDGLWEKGLLQRLRREDARPTSKVELALLWRKGKRFRRSRAF